MEDIEHLINDPYAHYLMRLKPGQVATLRPPGVDVGMMWGDKFSDMAEELNIRATIRLIEKKTHCLLKIYRLKAGDQI